jgi:hypothetical protein
MAEMQAALEELLHLHTFVKSFTNFALKKR